MTDTQLSIFGEPGVFDPASLPNLLGPKDGTLYRKKFLTRAWRIEGPFVIETTEGLMTCQDGYLAQDSRGFYYPIAKEEFDAIYVSVDVVDPDTEDSNSDQVWFKEKVITLLDDLRECLIAWGEDKRTKPSILGILSVAKTTVAGVGLTFKNLKVDDGK
jgi:hypothetical protein